jgi:hypothetical protein
VRPIPLQSKQDEFQEIIPDPGGKRFTAPAICRLHVRHDGGPGQHEVLWLDALHASESKS